MTAGYFESVKLSPEEEQKYLAVVVSMKSADITVSVRDFPAGGGVVVTLLAPADTHLTLRESCYSLRMSGPQVIFRFVPSGKYRIFIVDAQFQQDVAAYAPRSPDFLGTEAAGVEVPGSGQAEVTATYIDSETVQDAIRRAR